MQKCFCHKAVFWFSLTAFCKDIFKLQISCCYIQKTSFPMCTTSLCQSVINCALVDCLTLELKIVLQAFDSLRYDKRKFGFCSLRNGSATAAANARLNERVLKRHMVVGKRILQKIVTFQTSHAITFS